MDALLSQLGLTAIHGQPDFLSVAIGIVASFVVGQAVGWTYEATHRGLSYSRGFTQTLILSSVAAVVLVQAMGQSLLAGIGLFGILSMIRFRNTLKAPRDLIFLMGSVTLGVAVGVGAWASALLGTLAFCSIAFYLHLSPLGSRKRYDGLLRFHLPAGADNAPLRPLLEKHCRRFELLSAAEMAQGALVEHTFQVKLWDATQHDGLMTALRTELDAQDVRVLLQDASLEY
jgi:hypothetical protein